MYIKLVPETVHYIGASHTFIICIIYLESYTAIFSTA